MNIANLYTISGLDEAHSSKGNVEVEIYLSLVILILNVGCGGGQKVR